MFQTSSMNLYEDLTFFFAWLLVSHKISWEFFTFLDQIYSAEKRKENSPRRSGIGMEMHNMCAKNHGLSLKNGVDI